MDNRTDLSQDSQGQSVEGSAGGGLRQTGDLGAPGHPLSITTPHGLHARLSDLLGKIRKLNMKPGQEPPRGLLLDQIEADASELVEHSRAALPNTKPGERITGDQVAADRAYPEDQPRADQVRQTETDIRDEAARESPARPRANEMA